jgi:hypothetical protein
MRIAQVEAMRLELPPEPEAARERRQAQARRPSWNRTQSIDNPARRYAFARRESRGRAGASWETVVCKITAEDGTWGLEPVMHFQTGGWRGA